MRVDQLDEEERRVEKMTPIPEVDSRLPEHYRARRHHYDGERISLQCQRGSETGHNKCFSEQWCECPCHTAYRYDMMM